MLSVYTVVALYASAVGMVVAQSIDPNTVSRGTRSEIFIFKSSTA
jgi:hypothetical protein